MSQPLRPSYRHVHSLGACLREERPSPTNKVVGVILVFLLPPIGVFLIWAGIMGLTLDLKLALVGLGIGLLAIVGGISLAAYLYYVWNTKVYIFQGGFCRVDRSGTHVFAWEEIVEVIRKEDSQGKWEGYEVRRCDGKTFTLNEIAVTRTESLSEPLLAAVQYYRIPYRVMRIEWS